MTLRKILQDPTTTAIWSCLASNEFGHLMDGNEYGVPGTQAMEMVKPSTNPQGKAVTYASMVCDCHPLIQETHHCCLVVGGDKLTYASDSVAPGANLIKPKILYNIVLSALWVPSS